MFLPYPASYYALKAFSGKLAHSISGKVTRCRDVSFLYDLVILFLIQDSAT
jgi:hypothetical protein